MIKYEENDLIILEYNGVLISLVINNIINNIDQRVDQ